MRVQAGWILRPRTSAGQPQRPHQEPAGSGGGSACDKIDPFVKKQGRRTRPFETRRHLHDGDSFAA